MLKNWMTGLLALVAVAAIGIAPTAVDAAGKYKISYKLDDTNPSPTKLINRSTTVTTNGTTSGTPNTFLSVLAADPLRLDCIVVNNSANVALLYLGAPGSATVAKSIPIAAGGTFNCQRTGGLILTDELSLASGTASSVYAIVRVTAPS